MPSDIYTCVCSKIGLTGPKLSSEALAINRVSIEAYQNRYSVMGYCTGAFFSNYVNSIIY
jgi:hypothetical protein